MLIIILYNAYIFLKLINKTKDMAAGIIFIHMKGIEAFIFAAIILFMNNILIMIFKP